MNIQHGIFWLILTVFLEARDQSALGQKNVAKVILNRASKKDWPLSNIVFSKKQFSCWNEGFTKPFMALAHEAEYITPVLVNVDTAIEEWKNGDDLKGATHYYSPKAMVPKNRVPPWVSSMTMVGKFGDQIFYREG